MMNGQNAHEPQDKSLYMRQEVGFGTWFYEDSINVIMKGREIQLERILTIFTTIDLSLNSFEGNIPSVIGNLHSLIGLNLSHNHLMGSIPSTLGNLTNLEWLDLSSNKLSGRVPRELGDLSFLGYLNLSENQLIGFIPQDKQLSTFMSDSFRGNLGLCGTPLQNTCHGDDQPPPPPQSFFQENSTREHGSGFDRKVVGIGYASGIVIGISIAYILCETGRPRWLVRRVRRMERRIELMNKPKQKAIKFHAGQ
ncbi:putative receptor like protein 25 [Eucalyptus grandis]|uniref:putative receptor like protein 25 n=1 Tax=Eucalyptus grandis TaxID=71139 RepID=UPI00192EB324|nr:putative receptor like protein 25 [Eucalyptus grandis]